jgi:two-component system, NarL family, nitrate/nitrite response regulator NarL
VPRLLPRLKGLTTMTDLRRAVVVDGNGIFREGLLEILPDALKLECEGFESIDELRSTPRELKKSLFLADFGPGDNDVTNGVDYITNSYADAQVVVLSEHYRDGHMLSAFKAGACGYVLKQTQREAIIRSLQLICLGEHVFPIRYVDWLGISGGADELDKQDRDELFELLSPREIEVFAVLCEGKSNKLIARRCGITEATVKVHVKAILRKLKAKNRTEAAVWARDHRFPPAEHRDRSLERSPDETFHGQRDLLSCHTRI